MQIHAHSVHNILTNEELPTSGDENSVNHIATSLSVREPPIFGEYSDQILVTVCYAHYKRSEVAGEIIAVHALPAGASGIEVVNIFFSCTVATHAETAETVTMPARRRPARYPSTRVPGVVPVAIIEGR